MRKLQLVVLLVLLHSGLAVVPAGAAQASLTGFEDRRVMAAARLGPGESIELDGRLTESVWERAQPATDFIQIDPDNGAPATERTEVFVVYDENRMYMGVIAYDSEPDQLKGNTMLRDAPLGADDRFMWVFDTYLDERTGYFFEINPSGAMGDSLIGGGGGGGFGGGGNRAWDGIWTARVRPSEVGWVAEIEMPFRTLNFDPNGEAWGINFQRTVRRKNEESIWNGYGRNQQLRQVSNAGLLVGINEISQGVGLDIRPYVVGSSLYDSRAADPASRTSYTGDVGGDFVYNVTPSLRANFTINTDFAETAVDDRQVNLTRFSLRFPERREFFLEGNNFFSLSGFGDAFFSRQIGLNDGRPQRIEYGAKLTGQIGAEDIGVLQVRTAEENGLAGEDFTVLRGRRRFWSESHAGVLYTRRAVRDGTFGGLPVLGTPDRHTLGWDLRLETRRFLGDKTLNMTTHYVHTTNPAGTGKSGRYGLDLFYPNDFIRTGFRFVGTQENFDPAVGFVNRTGIKQQQTEFRILPRPEGHRFVRQYGFGVNFNRITDSKNQLLSREVEFTLLEVNFHSGDSFEIEVTPQFERLERDFRQANGSIVLPAGGEYSFNRYRINWNMSNQRPIAVGLDYSWGGYFTGTRREFEPRVSLRPQNGLVIDLSGEFNRIELAEGSFSTSLLQADINKQFSPWISVSNNIQYDNQPRHRMAGAVPVDREAGQRHFLRLHAELAERSDGRERHRDPRPQGRIQDRVHAPVLVRIYAFTHPLAPRCCDPHPGVCKPKYGRTLPGSV